MLRLLSHGRVAVTLNDQRTVELRPPTIAEYRKVRDAYRSANAGWREQFERELDEDPELADPAARAQRFAQLVDDVRWADGNPYGAAVADLLATLSDSAELDPERLPAWASDPGVFPTLSKHWTRVEVVTDDTPTPAVPPAPTLATPPATDDPPFDPVAAGLVATDGAQNGPGTDTRRPLPRAVEAHLAGHPAPGGG